MKNKLMEAIRAVPLSQTYEQYVEALADHLLKNGVMVTPCVVYNKKHERYQIVNLGRKQLHRFSIGFFRNRSEAEKALEEKYKEEQG